MRDFWSKWTDEALQLLTGLAQQQRLVVPMHHHLGLVDPNSASVPANAGLLYGRDEEANETPLSGNIVDILKLRDLLDASDLSLDEYVAAIRDIPDDELVHSQNPSQGEPVTEAESVEDMADEDFECKTM
jgi:hypothetical protein